MRTLIVVYRRERVTTPVVLTPVRTPCGKLYRLRRVPYGQSSTMAEARWLPRNWLKL